MFWCDWPHGWGAAPLSWRLKSEKYLIRVNYQHHTWKSPSIYWKKVTLWWPFFIQREEHYHNTICKVRIQSSRTNCLIGQSFWSAFYKREYSKETLDALCSPANAPDSPEQNSQVTELSFYPFLYDGFPFYVLRQFLICIYTVFLEIASFCATYETASFKSKIRLLYKIRIISLFRLT